MPEESATPDLVELTRQLIDAGNRRDLDAAMSLLAPHVVWESLDGLGVFDGATAVHGFLEDWLSSYEVFEMQPEVVRDIGNGIIFAAGRQVGRPLGATGRVEAPSAWAMTWEQELAVRIIAGIHIDEVRAAADCVGCEMRAP